MNNRGEVDMSELRFRSALAPQRYEQNFTSIAVEYNMGGKFRVTATDRWGANC